MEVLFIYFAPGIGHTKEVIDATPVVADGASEEQAIEWAAEKFANGREIVGVEFGTPEHILERLALVYYYVE